MELTHRFTVATPVEETWAHFQNITELAECFPGAQLTSAEGDTFSGTCKVKLGPIALLYTGSGTFVEKDDAAHRFVVDATGKDKRGNGTARAKVSLSMVEGSSAGTDVEVLTELAVTGKPAQFGRGVMQDVSDKLLGRFVDCLEERLAGAAPEAKPPTPAEHPDAAPASAQGSPAAAEPPMATGGAFEAGRPAASQPSAPRRDELNLGSTVLPVLVKTYWKQALIVLAVVALLIWWVSR